MPIDYKVRNLRRLFGEASFLRPAQGDHAPKAVGKIARESVKIMQLRSAKKADGGSDGGGGSVRRRTRAPGGVPRAIFSGQPPRSVRNKAVGGMLNVVHLFEKQKMKLYYGKLRDGQFKKYVDEAKSKRLDTDARLLRILELRLDTFLYRTGFVKSPGQSRHWIVSDRVRVNGQKVNIKSFRLKPGDVLTIPDKYAEQTLRSLEETARMRQSFGCGASWIVSRPDPTGMLPWMEVDRSGLSAILVREPTNDEARSMARAALFPYVRDANMSPHAAMRSYR